MVDGAQKMAKMYDSLMKSGKWTAQQNKSEDSNVVDSIGELAAICETEHFIPRYYVDSPKDKIDRVIMDNQQYLTNLVTKEMGLGNMIELAVKHIQEEKEQIAAAASEAEDAEKKSEDDALFDYSLPILSDKDISNFNDFKENEKEKDYEEEDD